MSNWFRKIRKLAEGEEILVKKKDIPVEHSNKPLISMQLVSR